MPLSGERILKLTGIHAENKSRDELLSLFHKVLKAGIHGLCFNPYLHHQLPGSQISEEQIRKRMDIIRPYTKWISIASCTNGNEIIPGIAREYGLKTIVNASLTSNENENENEISALIHIAREGYADVVSVGNEVLYREDMTEEELLVYILRVKNHSNNTPVAYADLYNAFEDYPRITKACDILLANCFPFWEGSDIEYSLLYLKDMYRQAIKAANGKKVIIASTGWPSKGEEFYDARASEDNAVKYFLNTQLWAMDEDIELFYFTSFDESWRRNDEGELGPYWGIWDVKEKMKYKEKHSNT